MVQETIFQSNLFVNFILPFLLIFFIVYAILEKSKVLGEDKQQVNALVAFVIGLIFVSAVQPVEIVSNMILFLTIAIIVAFVGLLLWGFVSGGDGGNILENAPTGLKWGVGIIITISVILALMWASGIELANTGWLFSQSWSKTFWTNAIFVVVVAVALAVVLKSSSD